MSFGCRLVLFIVFLPVATQVFATDFTVNGHLRGQSFLSLYPQDDLLSEVEDSQFFLDGSIDLRLNASVFVSQFISLDFGYEAAFSGGQRRKTISKILSNGKQNGLYSNAVPTDDNQLFSLTKVVSESNDYITYHRIDRLSLTFDSSYGTIRGGRQALTWGNGLVFNPADIVNPFAPRDIIRDYKAGADMVLYQIGGTVVSDFQLVYVPRKNPEDDNLDWSESTMGVKAKVSHDEKDLDLIVAKNYEDYLVGTGLTGYLGDTVYRADCTLTFLRGDGDNKQYLSAVANMDYSWTWKDQNWYGMIELYYNGLGHDNVSDALKDEDLAARLKRGELFVIGKWYFDGMVQYEIHPLVNSFLSFICNLEDQSFLLQPRIVWDYSQSSQLLTGIDIPIGNSGDEFGRVIDEKSGLQSSPGTHVYMVFTWFF